MSFLVLEPVFRQIIKRSQLNVKTIYSWANKEYSTMNMEIKKNLLFQDLIHTTNKWHPKQRSGPDDHCICIIGVFYSNDKIIDTLFDGQPLQCKQDNYIPWKSELQGSWLGHVFTLSQAFPLKHATKIITNICISYQKYNKRRREVWMYKLDGFWIDFFEQLTWTQLKEEWRWRKVQYHRMERIHLRDW